MGDGALAMFGTAMDAVNCALEIQRTSRADFEGDLRIGIHPGDITIENEGQDIFVHSSGLIDDIRENDQVQYEVEQGKKGLNAVKVEVVR